jgi:hypothetical protein
MNPKSKLFTPSILLIACMLVFSMTKLLNFRHPESLQMGLMVLVGTLLFGIIIFGWKMGASIAAAFVTTTANMTLFALLIVGFGFIANKCTKNGSPPSDVPEIDGRGVLYDP